MTQHEMKDLCPVSRCERKQEREKREKERYLNQPAVNLFKIKASAFSHFQSGAEDSSCFDLCSTEFHSHLL